MFFFAIFAADRTIVLSCFNITVLVLLWHSAARIKRELCENHRQSRCCNACYKQSYSLPLVFPGRQDC